MHFDWIGEKKMNIRRDLQFLLLEILTVILNVIVYNFCCNIGINAYLAALVGIFISGIFNYFGCTKFIFSNIAYNKQKILKFIFVCFFAYFLKKVVKFILNIYLSQLNLLINLIAIVITIIFNYISKKSIFIGTYKFDLKNIKIELCNISDLWKKFIDLKYVNYIFKFLPHNLFLFLFFIISLIYTLYFFRDNNDVILYKQFIGDANSGPIINESVDITFENIEITDNVDKMCLVFGTYNRENDSILEFNLYDHENSKVFFHSINTKELQNGMGFCLQVPEILYDDIGKYKLVITSKDADEQNHVTLLINKETNEPVLYLKSSSNLLGFKIIGLSFCLIMFFVINYFINKKFDRISEEKFIFVFLGYMLGILFLYPAYQVPDEPVHFYRSYNLSQNLVDADKDTSIVVPESFSCLNYSKIQRINKVTNFDDIIECAKHTDNIKMDIDNSNVTNTVLGYTPQAIAIRIADAISNSPLFIFYFARVFNFAISFIIIFLALRMAPVSKKLIFFVAIIPIFVQQVISLSYDAILNSLSLLFCAFLINKMYNKETCKLIDIVIPIVYLLVCITVKVVYFPMIILLLLIPSEKFNGNKNKILYLMVIIVVVMLLNYLLQNILFVGEYFFNDNVDKQLNYLLKNPLKIFPIAFNTLKVNGVFYLRSLIGGLGWFSFYLSDFTIISTSIYFLLLILSENSFIINKKNKMIMNRVLLSIAILISVAGIFGSMYLYWTGYKLDYIEGVQGRYFIPLLVPIAMLFMPRKNYFNIDKNSVYMFSNILLLQYIMYSIIYFY